MPRGDGTGPMGMGPMTGRGAGFCAGFVMPGYMNPAVGMGYGRGRGFRRMFWMTGGMPGWAHFAYPPNAGVYTTPVDEKELLSNQAQFLQDQLEQVKQRLNALEKEAE